MLDTSVIVEHLRGEESSQFIGKLQEQAQLATTIVNAFELYYGAYKSKRKANNLSAVKGFLSTLDVLSIDDASAEKSGEVLAKLETEGRTVDPRDLFIGCVAFENGYAVLTDNIEHFERIPDLVVLSPSEIQVKDDRGGPD